MNLNRFKFTVIILTGTHDASKHAKPFTVAPLESSIPLAITQYSFFGG